MDKGTARAAEARGGHDLTAMGTSGAVGATNGRFQQVSRQIAQGTALKITALEQQPMDLIRDGDRDTLGSLENSIHGGVGHLAVLRLHGEAVGKTQF